MSLQFIIGPAGSGKSHVLFSEVVEHAASHPEQTHLVLVPDQFTMQAQRKLVSLSPKRGILNIEALSFERLAYRIFEELGTDTSNVLEDTGKSLLLRKITNDLKEELVALSSGIDKAGFIDELKSLFSEFAQYAISPEDLGHFLHAPNMGKAFYQRISDIQKIYTAYEAALQDNYITTEQILTLLSDVADKSLFLKNAYMAFDGYTGFTPVQKKLFLKMLCLADKIRVSITMDPSPERDGKGMAGLFHMSREFQSGMRRLADEAQVPVEAAIILSSTGGRRFVKNGCLAHLEANLFRRNPVEMDEKTRLLAADEVRLFATDRGRDELVLAASEIRRRIQENPDLRFRDFAVLCADIEEYRYTIEEVFGAYEIPVFVDAKDVALRSSFVETVAAIVHLFVADFSYEAVMRLLKGGFLPIETEEIDLLDNYLLATGLRGKGRLGRVFDRQADGISAEDMVRLNETRLMLMDPFLEEGLFLSSDTMEGYVRCLYGRIVELDCEAQLWKEADRLEEQGDSESASRTLQVYPKVMDLFDKMVRLMGSVEVSLEEFESILLEGLSAIKIGVIPPSLDSVTFGDMERTRVSEIDTLFLIGMSDGRIPGHLEDGGLLLQSERERLIEDYRIELAPTARERAFRQRFYLYLALCRPARSLILSYSKTPEDGVSMGECYLFPMIRELFCGISVQEISEEERMFSALSEAALPERMADGLREYMKGALPQEKEALFAAFLNEIRERDEKAYDGLLAAGGFLYTGARIPAAVMKALQKNELAVSASRLEQYAACAYSYFLQYVLALKERKEHLLGTVDLGNLYHEALERYSKKLEEAGRDWFSVSREESDVLLAESIEETVQAMQEIRILDSARETYILERMRRTLKRTVWALTHQIRQGTFAPRHFEISLSELSGHPLSYELSDDARLRMSGIIDRMDVFEKEDTIFIKIIDYKSGDLDFVISDVYEGLQLQLILYMKVATDVTRRSAPQKQVVPAAVLYYQVKDPVVKVKNQPTAEEISQLIQKELRQKGVVCDNEEVLAALDQGLAQAKAEGKNYTSIVVPVGVNKNGSLAAFSHTVSPENFELLGRYVEKKVMDFGEEIMQGEISAQPFRKANGGTGCDFCAFHSVCGMDTKLGGYGFRKLLEEKDADVVLSLMRQRLGEGHGMDEGAAQGNRSERNGYPGVGGGRKRQDGRAGRTNH